MARIMIVDDEKMLTDLLSQHLQDCGYETLTANDASTALKLLPRNPDLILLDINMPGTDGLELCRTIRNHVSCPILFLTARISEQDKVIGLDYGGDDYITKPFSLKELTAPDGLVVNLSERRVFYRDQEILFSRREFDVLEFLLTNRGRVFDRERIYECVWGLEAEGDSGVIKEHIRKIRAKLREVCQRDYIETIWGVGYKWTD